MTLFAAKFIPQLEEALPPLLPYVWTKKENVDEVSLTNILASIIFRVEMKGDQQRIHEIYHYSSDIMNAYFGYKQWNFDESKLDFVFDEQQFEEFYTAVQNTGFVREHTKRAIMESPKLKPKLLANKGKITRALCRDYCMGIQRMKELQYLKIGEKLNDLLNNYGEKMGWNDNNGVLGVAFSNEFFNPEKAWKQVLALNKIYETHLA